MSAREDFLSHGWCSARGVLDSQSVGDARENVARYVSDVVPEIDSSFTYFEDRERPETLKQMQMMHEHDGWFAALAAKGPIPLLAELLLAREPPDAAPSRWPLFHDRTDASRRSVAGPRPGR